jgi:CMP-N-acetylneuraminic acid synthetase
LAGRPLLAWTVEAAVDAKWADRVIVSTEDTEIAQVAKKCGAEVPFLRPPELAGDNVHSSAAITHALTWLDENEDYQPDIIAMLLPTSPFRIAQHIDEAIALLAEQKKPAVIGVTKLNKHPGAFRVLNDGVLTPLIPAANLNVQRQDADDLYAVNGSIYVTWASLFYKGGTFHVDGAVPYILPALNSIDIDTMEDLELADVLGRNFFPVEKRSPDHDQTGGS